MYVFCTDVIREGNEVKGVVIESKAGREAILARTVIDCTGDADVAFRAGVECRKGDAEGGMQPPTLMFSMRGVATQRLRDAIAEHPDIYDMDIMPAESFRNEKFITVGLRNQIAKAHGFHDLTHEWDRTHHAENFDQIDSRAYLVHSWLKYPKFGHAAATDYTARYIRYGMMTREEAIPIIKARDGKLDPLCVRDFCDFCGYTESEFWKIMDKFYNRDLFEKNDCGEWVLKHPIWEENK